MKKLLLLLVPLLFLVGCESEEPAPSYDRIKYVEISCEGYQGPSPEKVCPVYAVTFRLTIESSSGSIYQINAPATDFSKDMGVVVGSIPNYPKAGDIWR
jgi:hypothetical protein